MRVFKLFHMFPMMVQVLRKKSDMILHIGRSVAPIARAPDSRNRTTARFGKRNFEVHPLFGICKMHQHSLPGAYWIDFPRPNVGQSVSPCSSLPSLELEPKRPTPLPPPTEPGTTIWFIFKELCVSVCLCSPTLNIGWKQWRMNIEWPGTNWNDI